MWDVIFGALNLLWNVVTDSRVDDAKQEANMWQGCFWTAVIIIAVLVFIIIMIRKDTDDRE